MPEITITLAVSSFVAGILMFLAPCTLPLVPGYLAFIAGVKPDDVQADAAAKRALVINAIAFCVGFTCIFVGFGILAGFFGGFVGAFRGVLTQIGGGLIVLFGLMMLNIFSINVLARDHKLPLPSFIIPGHPMSAGVIGSVFALGWTPCVGPVLATVLLLATTTTTVWSGGFLLFIFSMGLAVPFILVAVLYGRMTTVIARYSAVSKSINVVGGIFLILIGGLMLFNEFDIVLRAGYQIFETLGITGLYDHF